MDNEKKKKARPFFRWANIIQVILITLVCLLVFHVDTGYIRSWFQTDMRNTLKELQSKTDDIHNQSEKDLENYELVQMHITQLGAYYLNHLKEDSLSGETLTRLCGLLSAEDLYIIDTQGHIVQSSQEADPIDFTDAYYSSLLEVSEEYPVTDLSVVALVVQDEKEQEKPEDPSYATGFLPDELQLTADEDQEEEEKEEEKEIEEIAQESIENDLYYYVSCYLDTDHFLIVCGNFSDFLIAQEGQESYDSLYSRASYGKNGFCFVITEDQKLLYFPEDALLADSGILSPSQTEKEITGAKQVSGTDETDSSSQSLTIHDVGITPRCLKNGYSGVMTLCGQKYFCTVARYPALEDYLVCVLPLSELRQKTVFAGFATSAVVLFTLLLMRLYTGFMLHELQSRHRNKEKVKVFRNKLIILSLLCLVFTIAVNIGLKTLFFYSTLIADDVSKAHDLEETIADIDYKQAAGSMVYENTVAIEVTTAADLIRRNPDLQAREELEQLASVLGAEHILIYGPDGKVKASDLNYTGLKISSDPKSLSGEFAWVLRGEPYLIQQKVDETFLNHPYIYSGAPLLDEEGNYDGFVQLAMTPSLHDKMVMLTSVESILSSYCDSGRILAFVVGTEDGVIHSSNRDLDQMKASDMGLTTDQQLRDDFMGFFTLLQNRMLGCCSTRSSYWIVVASYTEPGMIAGIRYGLLSVIPGVTAEILFLLILLFVVGRYDVQDSKHKETVHKNQALKNYRVEEDVIRFIRNSVICVTFVVSLAAMAGTFLFQENSMAYYIFVYPWSRGFHIFTITRCLITICIVAFIMTFALKMLSLLGSLLPSKQETVIRLILSFVKYGGVLGTLFFCLTMLGVPTTSLLASAGVLSIVFSMGAQSLVADILAGLFIVFEGSFRVGDMITVNDWHGQVKEIGIRNTTIMDLISSDVKIMNNSTIRNVINYSICPSYSAIKVGIGYDMNLEELEQIIEREKPVIKENIPQMIGDLMYLGVEEFGESAVILKFQAACRNQDYLKVRRSLNREIKLMFDRNGITVPFPQIVLNEPPGQSQ